MKNWSTPSGIDVGSSITDGKTCRAFGVIGFPSVVIIDGNGRVAFNSSIQPADMKSFMERMQQHAKAANQPWPPREDMPREELEAVMTAVQVGLFSDEITQVLRNRPPP